MPVLVTRDYPPSRGGVQRYCEGLSKAIAASGERVIVIALDHPDAAAYDAGLAFPVIRITKRGRIATMTAFVRAIRRATRSLGDSRVIAAIWQPSGVEAILAGARSRETLTIIAHGSEITKQRSGVRRLVARGVLRRADVIAVSRFTSAEVASIGGSARVVPCGIPAREFVRERSSSPNILSVGRLVRRKGFDRLIAALPEIRRRHPDVRLEIVGIGPDRDYLEQLAADRGVSASVVFHGQVDDATLDACYSRAWLFAMPNRTEGGYDVEGLGLVFLEAAMHGVPSIGGKNSGAEDAIVDGVTGLIVDGAVQASVDAALATLVEDPATCERLGAAARERVLRDFSWPDIARRTLERAR